jgi:hypothetical protein
MKLSETTKSKLTETVIFIVGCVIIFSIYSSLYDHFGSIYIHSYYDYINLNEPIEFECILLTGVIVVILCGVFVGLCYIGSKLHGLFYPKTL